MTSGGGVEYLISGCVWPETDVPNETDTVTTAAMRPAEPIMRMIISIYSLRAPSALSGRANSNRESLRRHPTPGEPVLRTPGFSHGVSEPRRVFSADSAEEQPIRRCPCRAHPPRSIPGAGDG